MDTNMKYDMLVFRIICLVLYGAIALILFLFNETLVQCIILFILGLCMLIFRDIKNKSYLVIFIIPAVFYR